MSSKRDIIRWVIECMMRHDDSITEELALTVERESRIEWGGQRVEYVPKTCDGRRAWRPAIEPDVARRAHADALSVDLAAESAEEIGRRHGISRATVYRLLKRSPR